jgi:hypothetical protein
MWNRDSPVSVVSLHWWPRRDWSSLWPRLSRASSRTVTRSSCRQCDNPTWSHTAFLSQFHARCRSPFRLHNHGVGGWGGALWRACNLTSFPPIPHWSSGLTCLLPATRDSGSNPLGGHKWNLDSPVSVVATVPTLSTSMGSGVAQQWVPASEGPAEVQTTHKNLENIEEKTLSSCAITFL